MIMMPDAENNQFDDRHYVGELIRSIPLSQREIARRLGVSDRYMRKLVAEKGDCSYVVQFALEALLYAINHPVKREPSPKNSLMPPYPGGRHE